VRVPAYPYVLKKFPPRAAHSSKENRTGHERRGWPAPNPLGSPFAVATPRALELVEKGPFGELLIFPVRDFDVLRGQEENPVGNGPHPTT
jgi:hypothetical protein